MTTETIGEFRYGRDVLAGLIVLLFLGAATISRVERLEMGDAVYFAFITGLSVGYGDISPETVVGRVVSVAIGLAGVVFTGVTVAVTTRALADAIRDRREQKQ